MRRASGCLMVVAGLIIAAVGVPLLVLPGPGLMAIALGVGIMGGGLSRLRGRESRD